MVPAPATSQLAAALATLQGGLVRSADAARADLAGWLQTLRGHASLADVAQAPQRLLKAVAQNHHGPIAGSLSTLREQAKRAAVKATPDAQGRFYQLGDVPKQAAGPAGA